MNPDYCPTCNRPAYSAFDKKYLALNQADDIPLCWACDKDMFESGELSKDDFDYKELRATITLTGGVS